VCQSLTVQRFQHFDGFAGACFGSIHGFKEVLQQRVSKVLVYYLQKLKFRFEASGF
jgi:hypothetical protein